MNRGTDRAVSAASAGTAGIILDCLVEEGGDARSEALDLPVNLRSGLHTCSEAVRMTEENGGKRRN